MLTANEANLITQESREEINSFNKFIGSKNRELYTHISNAIKYNAECGYSVVTLGKKELIYPKDPSKFSKKELKKKLQKDNEKLILYLESKGFKCSWDGDYHLYVEWNQ